MIYNTYTVWCLQKPIDEAAVEHRANRQAPKITIGTLPNKSADGRRELRRKTFLHTQCHIIIHSVTSSYIVSRHHTQCHIIIHSVTSSYIVSRHHTQCHVIIHSVTSSYIVSHHHTQCHIIVTFFFCTWYSISTKADLVLVLVNNI